MLEGKATAIGGLPAYVVTYEIANVDQLRLAPDSRWRRARVVFVRTPYDWVLRTRVNKFIADWPVVAVIGYDADPGDFDAHLGEFGAFVGRLEFMTDQRAVVVHSDPLLKCSDGHPGTFVFDIDPDGEARTAKLGTSSSLCVRGAMAPYHFEPRGDTRTATVQLPGGPADPPIAAPTEITAPVAAAPPVAGPPSAAPAAP